VAENKKDHVEGIIHGREKGLSHKY